MADWPMHPRQHAYQAAKSRETELHQLVGTADKKFSYHKQIAHQHSGSKIFLTSTLDHHGKFGCCFSYCIHTCRSHKIFRDAGALPIVTGAQLTP